MRCATCHGFKHQVSCAPSRCNLRSASCLPHRRRASCSTCQHMPWLQQPQTTGEWGATVSSPWVQSLILAPQYLHAPPSVFFCFGFPYLYLAPCAAQHVTLRGHVTLGCAHRLLAYTPPGSGSDGSEAALLASSPQLLPLANPQTDPTPAIRSLVCKLAGIMCRQAEEIDRVMVSLGLRKKLGVLPNILPGAQIRNCLQNSLIASSHVAHPNTCCTCTSPTNTICACTL